jgi:hypothetical protein
VQATELTPEEKLALERKNLVEDLIIAFDGKEER